VYTVFLIGYGAVAGFNVGDEKPPQDYDYIRYLKENRSQD
jgi:hypothetical protein